MALVFGVKPKVEARLKSGKQSLSLVARMCRLAEGYLRHFEAVSSMIWLRKPTNASAVLSCQAFTSTSVEDQLPYGCGVGCKVCPRLDNLSLEVRLLPGPFICIGVSFCWENPKPGSWPPIIEGSCRDSLLESSGTPWPRIVKMRARREDQVVFHGNCLEALSVFQKIGHSAARYLGLIGIENYGYMIY